MAFDAFALVLALLALGKASARLGLFPAGAAEALNRFVLYVCLPAAVLRHASRLHFEPGLLGLIAIPWSILLASAGAVVVVARLLRLREDERAVLLLCVPMGNTSFLGYPLVEALLGERALPYAVIYDQFGSFIILSTWGLWVLARYGGDAPPTLATIAARVVRFPPFLALIFALTLMPESPPAAVEAVLRRLADSLLPVVAFAVGLEIRLRLPRREFAPLAAGLAMKLALMPAVAYGLVRLLGLDGLPAQAAILETAMPPMITASALAISHRLAPGLAAALAGYGVVLALLTVPLWRLLV
jgi:hypothetical protein